MEIEIFIHAMLGSELAKAGTCCTGGDKRERKEQRHDVRNKSNPVGQSSLNSVDELLILVFKYLRPRSHLNLGYGIMYQRQVTFRGKMVLTRG